MTELEKNARLYKELRDAKMERDILKKGGQHLLNEQWKIYQFISDHSTKFSFFRFLSVADQGEAYSESK